MTRIYKKWKKRFFYIYAGSASAFWSALGRSGVEMDTPSVNAKVTTLLNDEQCIRDSIFNKHT